MTFNLGSRKILLFILVISASYIYCQESYKCNVFRCSQFNLDNGQCIYSHPLNTNSTSDSQIFDINLNCPTGTRCLPIYDANNKTCQAVATPVNLVDGEICRNNTDCASNICNNEKCVGKEENSVCTRSEECKIGFYCEKATNASLSLNCLRQKKSGETCENDHHCSNNFGCLSKNKTCIEYFSLDDGEANEDNILLCKNMKIAKGHCVSTKLDQTTDECLPNNGTLQKECSYTTTGLPANLTDKSYKAPCACSRQYSNRNFCEYDTQNPQWQKLINAMKEHFYHDSLKKHTVRRGVLDYDLRRLYETTIEYPTYKDADECAINIEVNSSFTKISMIFVLSLVFILFGF